MNTPAPLDMPRNSLPPFLQKLRTITQSVNPDVASWSEDGKSYVVHKSSFTDILKQYFKGNLQTFVRQLHFYGFRKLDAPNGQWSFAHKSFLRDYPHLLYEIKRKSRLEPDANSASQAEVQALRTQVAYLQDVVEDLRSQLDVVLTAVHTKDTPTSGAKEQAAVGAKRMRTGESTIESTVNVKLEAPTSKSITKPTVAKPKLEQKQPAGLPSYVKLEDPLFSSSTTDIAPATTNEDVVSRALRDEEVELDLGDIAIEPVDIQDACSLGELSAEEWMDVMPEDKGLVEISMMPGSPSSCSTVSTPTAPSEIELPKNQIIRGPAKENVIVRDGLKVTDEATQMVAEATQLDSVAVSKVLAYLREAAVNLATGKVTTSSQQKQVVSSRQTKRIHGSIGRTVSSSSLTGKGGNGNRHMSRPCTPTPLAHSTVGETMNRKPNLIRSNSAPTVACSSESKKEVGISDADQCAVLLPLLLHIPQVQSALSEYKKFGVVGVEQATHA